MSKQTATQAAEQETIFGIVPILRSERTYGFWDFFFVVSGFGIAVWCYAQGVYIASLSHFSGLVCSILGGNMLLISIICLVMIPIVRYGIDSWVYMRAIYGHVGVKLVCIVIVLVNFPWYAIGADIFSSSILSIFNTVGVDIGGGGWRRVFAFLCIILGALVAIAGPKVIAWSNKVLVPSLILVAILIVIAAVSSLSGADILNYEPDLSAFGSAREAYGWSLEGNIAFSVSWISCIGALPRLCKRESHAYTGAALSYGTMVPLMCFLGGLLGIAMWTRFGEWSDDPAIIYAALVNPVLAIIGLILIAFSTIVVCGIGFYSFGIVLKSILPKTGFRLLIGVLFVYVGILVAWGGTASHLGPFMSIGGIIYAPVCGIIITDYFFVRKQRFSMRSVYRVDGANAYDYTGGFSVPAFIAFFIGVIVMLAIYNPITGTVHTDLFYFIGSTAWATVASGIAYYIVCKIPYFHNYVLRDRNELTK